MLLAGVLLVLLVLLVLSRVMKLVMSIDAMRYMQTLHIFSKSLAKGSLLEYELHALTE